MSFYKKEDIGSVYNTKSKEIEDDFKQVMCLL